MIILTDLADWGLEPLDSLVEAPPVKPRLTKTGRKATMILADLFPEGPAHDPARGVDDAGDWAALAVVSEAAGSQYDALLAAVRSERRLPGPVAAVAVTGRGFHGNRGRPWLAVPGNVHLSCAVPVDLPVERCAAAVPAVPVLAVGDALDASVPSLPWRIKWINDVLVGGAKLAGVLAAAQTRGRHLTSLVFGIGVNVTAAPPVPGTLFVPRATCLHDHDAGREASPGAVCRAVLAAVSRRLAQLAAEGSAPLVADYRARCGDVGRRVRVWAEGLPDTHDASTLPAPVASGRVLALDDDLALHVEGAAGPLVGGRLAHVDPEELAD